MTPGTDFSAFYSGEEVRTYYVDFKAGQNSGSSCYAYCFDISDLHWSTVKDTSKLAVPPYDGKSDKAIGDVYTVGAFRILTYRLQAGKQYYFKITTYNNRQPEGGYVSSFYLDQINWQNWCPVPSPPLCPRPTAIPRRSWCGCRRGRWSAGRRRSARSRRFRPLPLVPNG